MTTAGAMLHFQRAVIVGFHRAVPMRQFVAWLSQQPFVPWMADWLTWPRVIVIGIGLGLLLAPFAQHQ